MKKTSIKINNQRKFPDNMVNAHSLLLKGNAYLGLKFAFKSAMSFSISNSTIVAGIFKPLS